MKLLLCVLIRAFACVPALVAAGFLVGTVAQGVPKAYDWATADPLPAAERFLALPFPWFEAVAMPMIAVLAALAAWALWRSGGWCLKQ